MTDANLVSTVKVRIDSRKNCGGKGITHWFWLSKENDSRCFPSFAEAAQDAQESFSHYAEGF